jgi:xylan 1,4-beta-xylosidase
MTWGADGWLRTAGGDGAPRTDVPAPALPPRSFPALPTRDDFDSSQLGVDFQWLRSPWPEELFSLTERPGYLRLYGRESPGSLFRQALVARRQQAHCFRAETLMDFAPESYEQLAGLICYYNSSKFHYLYVSQDGNLGRHIRVMSCLPDLGQADVATAPAALPGGPVRLRVEVDYERLYFAYAAEGQDWRWIPQVFDASTLSDEAGPPFGPNFTGAFVGMCCQDLSGALRPADFDYFDYRERAYEPDPRLP